jgi:hypothetical protein
MRVLGRARFPAIARGPAAWIERAILGYAALAAACLVVFTIASLQVPAIFAALALLTLPIVTIMMAVVSLIAQRIARHNLEAVEHDSVVIDGKRYSRAEVRGAWRVLPVSGEPSIELELHGGRTLRAQNKLQLGPAMQEALGIEEPARKYEANDPSGWPNLALFFGPMLVTCAGAMLFAIGSKILPDHLALVLDLTIVLALGAVVLRWLRPREIVVGSDGVAFTRFGKPAFVSYERIARAVADEEGIELHLVDDTIMRVTTDKRVRRADIVDLIERRIAALPEPPECAGLLDRGARSMEDWRKGLRELVNGEGYRAAPLDPKEIERALRNPRVRVDQRIGAAIALREAGMRDAVRVAADEEPQKEVRLALEALADDEDVRDARIERACARSK